jgi:hypothetical protein
VMSAHNTLHEITNLISKTLGDQASKSGSVLYGGSSTLKAGRFYLMGLNPGGDPKEEHLSVIDSVRERFSRDSQYCSYLDEKKWPRSHHQRNVIHLVSGIGQDIRNIFSANAIFVRSRNAKLLPSDAYELASLCWPVHEYFLSKVRPEFILCLGNGDGVSSFSLLRRLLNVDSDSVRFVRGKSFKDGKYFRADINFKSNPGSPGIKCLVVGIPHPSWHRPSDYLLEFLNMHSGLRHDNQYGK